MSLVIDFLGGNCPVQGEGYVGSEPFYFRARGTHWTMSIGGEDVIMKPKWHRRRLYSEEEFSAGWMMIDEAQAFIEQSAAAYLAGEEP